MPSNLITTLFGICVSFAVTAILLLAPSLVGMKLQMNAIAEDAARVYAVTGDPVAVQNEMNADLATENIPTTWDGQTLVSVTEPADTTEPGVSETSTPTSESANVFIQYNAPVPFDRALTLFGGPALDETVPMTATASAYNEVQYTGSNSG